MFTVALATKTTVDVPPAKVAFAAVTVQLPPTVMVEAPADSVPRIPTVTAPAVTASPDVSRTTLPVGLPTEFWMSRVPPIRRPFAAIVYVIPAAAVVSSVRLLNSLPGRLPNVKAALAPSRKTTVPVPAAHDGEVEEFVQLPLNVHVPDPSLM